MLHLELLVVRFDLLSRSDLVAFLSYVDKSNASLCTLEYDKSSALNSLARNVQDLDN